MARRKKRNRKLDAKPAAFPSPLAAVLLTVGSLCIFYLWLCGRCDALGKDITRLEEERTQIRRRVMNEELKWTVATSQANLRQLLEKHRLEMILPDEGHIVRVRTPSGEALPEGASHQFAQGRGNSMND